MAFKVIWLPEAYEDLESIWQYIARNSSTYATGMVQHIVRAARDLRRFPRMGRMVPEWNDPMLRERIIRNYRLIYRLKDERVIILGVIHGARILSDDLKDKP